MTHLNPALRWLAFGVARWVVVEEFNCEAGAVETFSGGGNDFAAGDVHKRHMNINVGTNVPHLTVDDSLSV